jgi:triosephosphate isomerase
MNILSELEAKKLVISVKKKTAKVKNVTTVFCPPFVYLPVLKNSISKNYYLGAQNIGAEEKGSFTGEVSVNHIKQYKVSHCIVGHSERRKMGENDEMVSKKVRLCLNNKIKPVVCIGETVRDENGEYLQVIKNQLKIALSSVSKAQITDCIIAYEPVFSIGASKAMDEKEIHETVLWIKKCIKESFGDFGGGVKILYGGSVNFENAQKIVETSTVDGLLVGRDSLDAENFSKIINNIK